MAAKTSSASALSPEYALLGLLAQHPAHGYELHQTLRADLGQVWHIRLSQVYNILNRLEAQGLILGTLQEQAKLPARRRFRLTPSGRRHFESWLHAPTGSSSRAIRIEFITRLYFARALGAGAARAVIDAQTAETRQALARLQALLAQIPPDQSFNRLGLALRVRQLASILDWLAECYAALNFE